MKLTHYTNVIGKIINDLCEAYAHRIFLNVLHGRNSEPMETDVDKQRHLPYTIFYVNIQ